MMSYLNHQVTGNDDVAFLAGVGSQLDILVLRFLAVGAVHVKRLRDTVQERRRQVVILHSVRLVDPLTFTGSCHRIGPQCRTDAFDNIGYVNTERERAAVNKREVEVFFPVFARQIFLDRNAGLFRHLSRSESCYFSQLPDTERHFLDLKIKS